MDFSDSGVRSRSFLSNDPSKRPYSFYSAERNLNADTYVSHLSQVAPFWAFVPDDPPSKTAGYYYYTKPVPAGASTDPLMTYVKTMNATPDDIRQYDIMVYAESKQITDYDGTPYPNYLSAWSGG